MNMNNEPVMTAARWDQTLITNINKQTAAQHRQLKNDNGELMMGSTSIVSADGQLDAKWNKKIVPFLTATDVLIARLLCSSWFVKPAQITSAAQLAYNKMLKSTTHNFNNYTSCNGGQNLSQRKANTGRFGNVTFIIEDLSDLRTLNTCEHRKLSKLRTENHRNFSNTPRLHSCMLRKFCHFWWCNSVHIYRYRLRTTSILTAKQNPALSVLCIIEILKQSTKLKCSEFST